MNIRLRFKVVLPDDPNRTEFEREAVISVDTEAFDDNLLYLIQERIDPYELHQIDPLDVSDVSQLTSPIRKWSSEIMNVCRLVAQIDPASDDNSVIMRAGGTFKDYENRIPDLLPCSGDTLEDFIDGLLKDDERVTTEIEMARNRSRAKDD